MTYEPGTLQARVTFTNKGATTAEDFKTAVEDALANLSDDAAGPLVSPPNAGDTGVIIGNG